jgi:hypothetical protein
MRLLLGVMLVLVAIPANARTVTIPPRFQGEFNAAPRFCGTGLSDMRLRISATKIRFYESEGTVKSILTQPNGEITILAEYAGEGETWTDMGQFALSSDGRQLTVRNPSSEQTAQQNTFRIRCPRK